MYFRAFYTYKPFNSDGCVDGETNSKAEFIDQLAAHWANSFEQPDQIDVWSIREIPKVVCPKCGQVMGNLGLVYDECMNEACDLYLKDPRPYSR